MPATADEVRRIITTVFPGSNPEDVKDQNNRVVGTFLWDGFKGVSPRDRNQLVTEKVRTELGPRGLNVGYLIPLAPGDKL